MAKGTFEPKNPRKYIGDPKAIVYRSSWELVMMRKCDQHPGITRWASEEVVIPYISPKDGRKHRYFPDFYLEMTDKDGKFRKVLIEVKPRVQVEPPKKNKNTKRFITEMTTWGVNQAKWNAAREFCRRNGWEFMIYTEVELGIKF